MLTAIMLSAAALGAQSPPSRAPRVFIEAFRSTDTLGRRAAVELRVALQRRVSSSRLTVLTTRELEKSANVGSPDDFGNAWGWNDAREAAKLFRIDVVVDLSVSALPGQVEIRAMRVRPAMTGTPSLLPVVRASTLFAAVELLARRLATDTVLVGRSRGRR